MPSKDQDSGRIAAADADMLEGSGGDDCLESYSGDDTLGGAGDDVLTVYCRVPSYRTAAASLASVVRSKSLSLSVQGSVGFTACWLEAVGHKQSMETDGSRPPDFLVFVRSGHDAAAPATGPASGGTSVQAMTASLR